MKEQFELNGFKCTVCENYGASLKLSRRYKSEEVIVPSEINGFPVRAFLFNRKHVRQQVKRIVIPASVERFYFNNCWINHNIEIEINENNPCYFSDGKALYTKDRSELICFSARGDEEYKIADGCKIIRKNAFFASDNLKRIYFPEGLNLICKRAFYCCRGITELELPNGLVEIGDEAFEYCSGIKKLTLPPTLRTIGGDSAFSDNSGIYNTNTLEVRIPEAFEKITPHTFPRNWRLSFSETDEEYSSIGGLILTKDKKKVVALAEPPEDGVLIIPDYVEEIRPIAFYECEKIKKVILPPGLHTIGNYAFSCARNLAEIDLENVKVIGTGAFERCDSLEKIRLKCNNIKERAFAICSHLIEAEVDCKRVGRSMFSQCAELRKVVLKNTKIIDDDAFFYDKKLKNIVLPPELEIIGRSAFVGTGLSSLNLPKSIKKLGDNIAQGVEEIHIFDNYGCDITYENDISFLGYQLFVHSAETGEIKYAVPIVGVKGGLDTPHRALVGMFKSGTDFDFQKFDSYFDAIPERGNFNIFEKYDAGMLRLKYGYELDDLTRHEYETRLGELAIKIALQSFQWINIDIERLMDRELYTYMSIENLIRVIEESTEQGYTELTALLLQILHEKRQTP